MKETKKLARELIRGAYDLHTHSAPSHVERALDDFQLLREADQVGLAGVLLKCHYQPTEARAALANQYAGVKTRAYGAITLNWPVGGLNPYAVSGSLKLGAKMVHMPTRDAWQALKNGPKKNDFFQRPGICILDSKGALKPEVHDILDVVKEYDSTLTTGHLGPEESLALCAAALERGVRMVLLHPDWEETRFSLDQQIELTRRGVLIEKCWINTEDGSVTYEEFAHSLKAVGAEHIYITTDRGQAGKQKPAEAMLSCLEILSDLGLKPQELTTMIHDVPRTIVHE